MFKLVARFYGELCDKEKKDDYEVFDEDIIAESKYRVDLISIMEDNGVKFIQNNYVIDTEENKKDLVRYFLGYEENWNNYVELEIVEMNRKELIAKIYKEVDIKFQEFKNKVVNDNMEDYCDEMALMYNFKKYLQYIEHEEKEVDNDTLEFIVEDLNCFVDTFMEMFWNSDLGNSYTDIKNIIIESVAEMQENKEV